MSPDVNFLNVSASPLALPVQTSNSLIPTLQSNNSLSIASYAIRTDQTVTINGGGDLDGNPLLANDDALIYAAKGFTFNNVPILPVNRNTNGDPIYDALTGKQVLVDNAVTVASGYTTINANNNPYIGLLPPKVVAPEVIVIPSYIDTKTQELNARTPLGASTITFNASSNPINNTNDWNNKFPPSGTSTNPKIVRVTGGGLNIPNGINLSNYIITVESGDINFNGNSNILDNVVLVTNNGNINLGKVQSNNLSVFASGAINMNSQARFGGKTLIANNSGNITFDGATKTATNADAIKVISQGNITFNGSSDTRGDFLSQGTFIANGKSFIFGSINAKQNIIFNGGAYVTAVSSNNAPSNLALSNNTTLENVAANSLIGTFTSTDPDTTPQTFTYSLVTGTGSTDNAAFTIVNNELHIVNSPDFEAKNSYSIRVRTTDQGGLSFERVFTVGITDVNEAPTALVLSNNTTPENVAANSLIGTFTSTDPDTTPQTFTYSLVAGTGSTDNAAFTIANNELRIVNSPDFEAKNSYSIRVRTTDQGGLSYEKVFTVNILNVNEAPTLSAIANQTIASGTLLSLTAIATDPDQPTNLTYSLEPNAPTGASINPITGVFTWTPTISQAGTYTIGIRVTDDGNPSLSDFKTFQTVVINPNLAPTDLALSPSSIAENVPVNTEVGSFSSIDPDTGNSFTYSLVNGIGDINNNLFTIENGKLKLNFSPDFESKNSYSIRVKTTDQGGLSFEKALIISITDVNEAPTALVLSNNTTPENVAANTLIGKFTSTDPDSTPQTFTYSLVAGSGSSDNTSFSIINNELHIINSPDFETKNTYSIRVKTTDQGGLSYEKVFTVNITNINEAPVFTSDIKNNGSAGQPYQYNITTSDPENNSLDITAANLPSWLTLVDNHDGTAKLQGTPSFTDSGIYNIQLKARENSTFEHLEANQNFYISVDLSLKEQSFFSPIRSIPITIPSQPSILQFKIDGLNFDTAALNSIHDAFEVSLVDSNGKPLTLTIGAGRSSFFNLSESSNIPSLTAATTYDPITGIVKLNLTGIPANTSANLVFRLINDDADTTTQVTIKDFAIVNAPLNTLPAQQTVLPASPSPTPLNLGNTIDVSSSILPQYDRTSFNQDSKLLYASLALKNSGTYAVNNPLLVAVTNISDPTVQVRNTNGFTPDGLPYYDFSALVNDGKLNQGQITEIGNLIFYNPNQVQFTYKLQVLSTLNRSPVITSQPNSEVIGGKTYTYNVKATDPDSDNLTYKLLVNPDGMTINSQTGVITWVTTTADIGNKSISVEVSDGRGGVSKQDYNLAVTDIPPNRPPAFVTNPVVQAYINKLYQYDSQAIDPDQDSLTYSVVIGPEGLKVDPTTGKVEWTAPPSLILGDTVIGQINVPGQNQEFNFSGKAGQKFYFDPLQYTGSRENWSFQIYSPSGQLVANTYLAYYDSPLLSLNEDGNYKIVINPSGDTVGSYGFRVVNPELLPITNFDKVINDTLNLGSQDNLYRFTASKGQKLYFDMQSRAYDKMDWVLYDPRNVAIAANSYMDDMEVDIQTDGEYILAIRGRDALTMSNSYAFSIINSPLPVTPMTLGTTISGNLKKGEQDTFTFTGTAGQQLFFDSLVHPYNSSYFIAYIYDPSGVQVDTFDSRSDRSPDNAGLRLTADGTYKIKIDGPGENNGAYAFRLLDKAAANPIALDTEFSGTLGNGGYNIELFQFELTSRQYLYFDTTSLGYDNYYPAYYNAQPGGWQLYDTSGQLYYSQRLWEDREGWLEAGKYTLAIQGYGAGYESRYKFNLVTPELTTKPAITFGSDVSGTLNEKGAQDYYTFTGTAGQLLYFDSLSNNPNNLSIIVYDPTGREVVRTNSRSDLNPNDYATLRLTMNGTYRITVDGDGEAIGNYKFRFLNKADSPLVALDTDIMGTFDNDNLGSVGYRFNIPTQTYVYIDGQQGNGTWYIYNASGQRVTGTSTNSDQELWLGAGEYWLVAQGNGYGDSNYKLRIITPDLLVSNITLNTNIIGTIAEKGEQDYYRFEGKAGQVLFFDDLGTSSGIYATLYDPNGRYTGFQISQGDGNPNDYAGLRLTSDGTYQINIDGSGETTGTYGFRLLNMADSPLADLNTDITGTFDNSDRGSVGYRFNLAERTYIYVDGQLGDGYWTIYNASGQRVTGNYTNADQELWLNAGEYWLVAQGNGYNESNYKLKIITPDLLATPLVLNGVVTGSISTKGEQDYYTFTGIAGDKLFLDALGSDPNLSFYITDPFGRNVYSTGNISDAGPDTNNTSLLLTKNGTYTITIDGNGEVTGNYKFRILSDSSSPLISIGDIIQGTFDNGGVGSNGYRFIVTNNQTIHVDIQNGQSPNYWVIYGGDGQVVTRQSFPNSADVNLTKGEYWLVAIGNSSADNTYKLQINSSYLASSNDPTPIPYIPNTTISGTIASSIVSPILNSNNSPVPYTVTASSEYYGYYPAYRAFDGSLNGSSFWATNGEPNPFIQIDLGTPTTVSGYSFVSRADGEYNQSPRWWVLSGSNDGTTFTSLDSRSGQPVWGVGEKREYALATADNYRYYRWTYTTEGAIGQNIISIQEIQLLNSIVDSKKIYSFDATLGQSFKFDSLSLESNLKYSIIDPNGRLLISNANEIESSKEIFVDATGTYKLIINSATKDGGSYRFNLVPTLSTPIPYSLNTAVSGTIASSLVSPTLTSNTSPSPYRVTASSINGIYQAYNAFDGKVSRDSFWASNNNDANPFIQIDLGSSTQVNGYSFVSRTDGEYNQSPREWSFTGSNDGINFTELDSKSGQSIWGVGEKRGYVLGNIANYRYYRWTYTTQAAIGQNIISIQEIQLLNSVSTGDTKKVYSFDATAGQGLYFDSLTSNSALQYSIIDPKGRTLVKQGNLTSDRGEIFIGETGTYQLIIDSVGGYAGNYSFNLVPYGNSSTIPTPVTLGSNLSGTFGADGREAKFYRFTANANQLLAIDPSGDSNNYWFIYSPKGDTVASGRLSKYKEFFLNQTGEYTLVIAGNGAANNSYQLNLLAPSTTTAPLAIGTDISGNISTKGQYDTYTFTGKAGQQLFYDALGGDNYLYVTVYDPTGRKIVDRANNPDDRNFQDGLILQMNGTYTLQIGGSDYNSYYDLYETYYPTTSPYTTHTGNYKFRLLDKADATAVNVGDYITGTFDNGALGSKLYKLSLTETKALYFDGLQGNGTFRIYNSNGYEITNLNLNDGYDRELTLGAGEYLIVMQGRGSASNYQLRISQPPAYLNVPIDFDTVISDSITDKGAKRYYSFNGKAGKQLFFDGLGGSFSNNLVVYDPIGRVIFNQSPQYDAAPSQGFILQMDGVYQIVIDSSSHYYYDYSYVYPYLGDYKFRLLDKDNATVVNVGDDITGTFDNEALGSKAYKLTLTETKFLYFDGIQGNGVFHLYSPDGQEITSLGLSDGHDREFNLGAGEYLIVMQGNGNDPNYKLHISEPIIPPTESIDLGAVVSGNISEKGVKRYFTFTGTAGHQLFYDALGSDYNFVTIYDPTGRRVFFQDGRYDYNPYDGSGSYSNLVNNSTGLILQMNGTYTVVIDASDHDYYRYYASQYDYVIPQLGNYKFRLLDKVLAPAMALDTFVSGISDNGGLGTTQYRLNISERKYVYFDAQGGSGNWIVYSPDGKTRVASSDLSRSQEFWLDAGEYTIAIQGVPQGSNTVPYKFKIVTPDLISTAYKVGDTISGSISEKGEKDYYIFEGKPGQRLFFDGLSTTANIYATLTSPTGKTIFSRLDTQSNYANEVLDENGIYTLTIDGSSYDYYGNVSLGNYSLRLLEYANASSFATSQAVLVQPNTDITGSLSDANGKQSNLYRFSGTQGQTLYIDTIAGDPSNFWGIYAPNGTSVTYGNLSTSGEIVLSQTGEYTLEVQGRGASNRDYTIRLITPNSSIANYTLGNVISTSLARKGETDTYSFTGNLGQRLFFDSITAPPNVRARLYSPTDVLLKDSLLSEGDWLPETLAETGKYRLVIDGDGGAIGNYSFSLSDRAIASEISLATSISGTVAANSANLYKLNGKQGQVLSFDLTAPNLVGASWVIYDPSGIAIATPSSSSPDFKVALASTGIYSLVINGNSGGEYSFQVTDITPAAVDNSGIGVVQTVSINNAGATVDYEFTGKAGTQIYFDAQAYDSSNGNNNYYYGGYDPYSYYYSRFRLINPDGTVALDNQSATSDQVLTLSQTGTYRLQAYSVYTYANFKYNLLEMPNSFGSPTLNYLALNYTVTGTLNNKETKIYTFQNSVGTKVLFNGMYGDGVNAYLYDPSGRVVMSLGVNSSDSAPYTLTQEGLYHLAISGVSTYSSTLQRSYSFQLLDASTSQEVEYNLPITGSLDNGEKGNFYKITAEANKILYFDNLSFNTNWYYPHEYRWTLYGAGNNVIASNELRNDFEVKIDKAGEYYLYVAGAYATNPVDYKFRVVATDISTRRDVIVPGSGTSGAKNDDGSLATVAVELQAKDGKGGTATQNYDIKLFADPDNANPVITSIPNTKYSLAEDGYRYQVKSLDPDSDSLVYRLINSPIGAVINRDTGELLWFPSASVLPGSKANFTVEVSDGRGGKDTQTFTVDVYGNLGKIQGAVFDDLNGNGLLDSKLIKGDNPSVVLAIDVSGSTAAPFLGTGKFKDVKTVLDAEIAAIKSLVSSIIAQGQGSKLKIGFLPFTTGATIQDMDLVMAGLQEYTTALADSNGNGTSNISEVLALPLYHIPDGGSKLNNVIEQIDTLVNVLPGTPNLIFMSDGYFSNLNPTEINTIVSNIKSRGGNVTAFGIGDAATTDTLKAIDPDVIKLIDINELSNIFTGFDERYALEPFKENVSVYLDLNNDGQYEAGEPTQLTKRSNAPNSVGQTPYYYTFDHLTPGNYTVRILTPNGYSLSTPDTGFATDVVTTAGETFSHLFGVTKIATPVNTAPQFTTIPPELTQLKVGQLLNYKAKAIDPDADSVTYSLVLAPKGMTVDNETGTVIWNPTKTQIADYYAQLEADRQRVGPSRAAAIAKTPVFNVLLRAQDGKGGQALQYIKVELLADNQAPIFTSIFPSTTPQANKTFQYQVNALDPNNDTVTFSLVTAPSGATINASTGLLTWQPTSNQVGDNNFTIKVTDGKGGESLQTGKLSVIDAVPNRAPTISSTPRNSARYGNSYSYEILATDADGDALTYSLVTAPAGMTIKDNILSWLPSSSQFGDNNVSVKVTDTQGASSIQTFQIRVGSQLENKAPTISSAPNLVTTIDREYQYDLSGSDPNGDRLLWSLDKAPTGMVIDATTGRLRWQPTVTQIGEQAIAIRVSDNYGAYSVQEYTLKVNAINTAPNILSTPITKAGQGQPYVYNVVATDAENDAIRYSLISYPTGMSIDSETGKISWTPSYNNIGSYKIQVQATDSKGIFNTQTYQLEIVAAPNLTAINHTPSITSTPIAQIDTTKPYRYQVVATDVDAGDSLSYGLINGGGATGITINPATGLVTWDSPTLGTYNIEIGVTDSSGARATQGFTLNVSNQPSGTASNKPPQIVSTPITRIGQGQAYSYEVLARDPENNPVTYSLKSSPNGMAIDANTGKISWTGNTVGSYNVEVQATDSQGGFSSQSYQLEVIANPINHAPNITSTPQFQADTNSSYRYQVTASDPDAGDKLEYQLISNGGATGLAIDRQTGLLTGNNLSAGNYKVVIGVVDEGGLGAAQGFTLTARANQLPVISSDNPPTKAVPNVPYVYDLRVSDPDGGSLKYSLDDASKNLGISIDELGRLRWTPSVTQIGAHPITISITDESGGVISQNFTINVQADSTAPSVKLTYAGSIPAAKGSAITFQVQATDDVKVSDLQLLVDGQAVPLDNYGIATVVLNKVGNIQIVAKAIDVAGNVGQDTTVSIPVFDPNAEAHAPKVSFQLFGIEDAISSLTDIKGLVDDPDDNLQSYVVDIAAIGTDDWTTIITGNSEVNAGGVLGKFDPSIFADDSYRIRLTATDTTGLSSSVEEQVNVVSQGLKLGNFTLSFTDLSIPISGIPINVTRTYDSLNAKVSDDFGYGWRLEFRDTDLRTSLAKDEVYEQTGLRTQAFKDGTKVFITLPGGKRETFTFKPTRDPISGYFPAIDGYDASIYHPAFTSEKGSTSTLTVVDTKLSYIDGKYYSLGSGVAYNPADGYFGNKYILTTKEGIVYEIDGTTGDLNKVTNPNGNTLTFTDAGITASTALSTGSDTGKAVTFQRDASGRITSVTDPLGQVVKYQYDAKGDLIGVTDQESQTTQFIYSVVDRPHYLNEIKDPLNKTLAKTEYDEQGRLKKVLNGANGSTEIAYDPANQVQTIKDALGNPTTYVYDARGNVIQQVDALGHQTLLEYDDDNNLTKVTDPNDLVTKYTYDTQGNLISKTEVSASCGCGGVPGVTTYTYNSYGQNTSIVLPTGASLKMDYDDRGNMLSMKDGNGNVINSYTYDRRGNVLTETDTFGTTSYEYDLFGNVIRSTDALGKVTTSTYDANGKLKTLTDADGTSTFSYDKLGRQTKADYGNNIFVEYGYSGSGGDWTSLDAPTIGHIERKFTDDGKLAGWVTADGGQLKYEYDAAGRLYREIDPAGRITEYEYDAVGRVIGTYEVDRLTGQKTKYSGTTYDAGGRVMTQTDVFGNTTTNTYGFDGKLATTTNSKNQTYTYSYTGTTVTVTDPLGRKTTSVSSDYYVPTETIFSNGKKTSAEFLFDNNLQEAKDYPTRVVDIGGNDRKYTYDSFGRITSATDLGDGVYGYSYTDKGLSQITSPTGETLRYEYDSLGNLKRTINGDGSAVTNSYNASDNRLAKTTLASGDEIAFTYDSAGRVISQSATSGGTTGYSYNADGAITSLQNTSGTTSYTYDNKGRVSTMTDANGSSISYRYDLAGRVLQTIEKASSTSTERITEYGYDVLGNLTSVKDTRGRITTMTYDAVNRLSEKTLPNGVKTVYSYDELDQVSKIETRNSAGVVLSSMTYERTGVGEPSKITREDGSFVTYGYDSALRLTKESYFNPVGALQNEITYGYDASGKRISKNNQVYAYNNAYQLQTVTGSNGSESYGYDADGRVSAINRDGQTLSLSHDSYDRLTQANDVTYLYDGNGNRIKAVSGASERKFLQASNGGLDVTELLTDASGNVISDYVYGNGSTPIEKIDANGNSVYYLTDAMGSVIGEVDGDGNLITRIQYDGFGNVWSQSGGAIGSSGGDFRFQGQWLESESGLYYFRARDYDSKTGLFLSRDAVAPSEQESESMNPYQFAYQNPLVYSDPSGMFTILELNASQSIETTLAGIRTYAGQEAKNYLLKKLGDAFSNVISSALNAFLPGSTLLKDVMNGTTEFENGLKGVICPYFDGLPLKDNLFLEVRIDNGIPKNNGFNCSNYNQVSTNPKVVNKLKSLPGSYPDFLFRNSLPLSYKTKDSGAYIIGDVKFFIGAARKDILSNDNQWQNMAKYASSYQILPFVSYLALFETNVLNPSAQGSGGLSKTDKLKLAEEALKKNVILILANIIDK